MRFIFIILAVLTCFGLISIDHTGGINFDSFKELSRVVQDGIKDKNDKFSFKNSIDEILLDVVPWLAQQNPSNLQGNYEEYKDFLYHDHSNEAIVSASVVEICQRSGYEVETYRVVADDDYITRLFRIVNPKADKTKLKQPPIMCLHGALVDPTAYVFASSIQHHPEKYPRSPGDGPITSWNRSLAFTLANNGYDVWLVGTRGASKENQGRAPTHGFRNFYRDIGKKNMTLAERLVQLRSAVLYWRYSFDDLIEHEIPRQLEKVLEITRARNVSLFAFSYGTMITLPFLGSRPDIAKNKIHNYVALAPPINFETSNIVAKVLCKIIPQVPIEMGTLFFTKLFDSWLVRRLTPLVNKPNEIRYSLGKLAVNIISGSSGKYRTMLEPAVMGHANQPTSFQQLKHACQQFNAKRYQKFDYGLISNKFIYGTFKPPAYNISDIHVKNWMLIVADQDNFACKSSIQQILREVNPKPVEFVNISGYNHIDLVAGVDNDVKVNLPVLRFFDKYALPPPPSPRYENQTSRIQ